MNSEHQTTITRFIEQMGMHAQADGLPRICGKILGLMLIENGPFTFSSISEKLAISRGSVSTNTRLLENLGIIDRISQRGQRQDYFQLAKDPYLKLLTGIVFRMKRAVATVQEARSDLPTNWKQTQDRLQQVERFYQSFLNQIESLEKEFK